MTDEVGEGGGQGKEQERVPVVSGVRERVKLSYPHSYQSRFTSATVLAQCLNIRMLFEGELVLAGTTRAHPARAPDYADVDLASPRQLSQLPPRYHSPLALVSHLRPYGQVIRLSGCF